MTPYTKSRYLDAAERARRSRAKQLQAEEDGLTPDWFIKNRAYGALCLPQGGVRVAVVGGGYAGLMAAWYLMKCGVDVTVYEAMDRIGGRVQTDRQFVKPFLVEAGAELIGENHALWFRYAAAFGLPFDLLTEYPYSRIRFAGHDLTSSEQDAMEVELETAQIALGRLAVTLDPDQPWLDKRAVGWDALSVAQGFAGLGLKLGTHAQQWFAYTLGDDNCAPIATQSFLGLLGSISAARMGDDDQGMRGYWLSTETHRCRGGNDLLGQRLAADLRSKVEIDTVVRKIQVQAGTIPPVVVTVERSPSLRVSKASVVRFDHVILTVPTTVYAGIKIEPTLDATSRSLTQGPAVKFITRYPSRFWIGQKPPEDQPNAKWDEMGSLWEGTDAQKSPPPAPDVSLPDPPVALSVFSGGAYVHPSRDYPAKVAFCYPHGQPGPGLDPTLFCDWPNTPFVMTGYGVPAVGEASRVFAAQRMPHAGRVHFAGEHTSSGFFGYMEGALQSGARAARDVINAVAASCPKASAPQSGPWMT